jgi:hypothetical protein
MDIKEGLQNYEFILLVLGILLFFVLLFLLIFCVVKNRSIKPLLLFFVLSLVMIGFPGIQKIKFEQAGIEFEKAAKEALNNPTPENKKIVSAKIHELEKQPNLSENRQKQITMLRKELNLKTTP